MPLDLNRIKTGKNDVLTEPRDIFTSLPRKPWPRLRVEQDQVLKTWHERRSQDRDLVIKQNTGGGKTVVGLLVGKSSLNEGVGPVAYLVPDTYLVQQVVDEADGLGVPVTTDARDQAFRAGRAILVATFHKVINGRTVFGLDGNPDAVVLGTVVVDDAHAALAVARKQFTVTVPAAHPAFDKALSIFGEVLKRQSYKNAVALLEGDHCAPLRIPFWSWSEKHNEVTDLIAASAAEDAQRAREWKPAANASIYFAWPLIGDHLDKAVATISDRGLQMRTPCPPIHLIPAFHQAKRRIYLTATLADDGVLVTELGADADSVRRPITPERATDLGDRLILAPGALNPSIIDDSVRKMAFDFAQGDRNGDGNVDAEPVNVVVLVPSDARASLWAPYARETLHVDDMKPVIDRLSGEHVGLIVLVNKYDGVDLPHGACRLLVVDGVPTPLDPGEQREAGALAGSDVMRINKVQRLEQGMGRGIRDAEDHCAVILIGNSLALSLIDNADRRLFSPATLAQIDLSQQVAEQIEGEGMEAVRDALTMFLVRDETWLALSSRAIAGSEYDPVGHVSRIAQARRVAWGTAVAGDPGGAADLLRAATNSLDPVERGWRLEEVAAYRHEVNPEEAQQTIAAAKRLNNNVLMPAMALRPRRVRGRAQQAKDASEYMSDEFDNGNALRLRVQEVLDDLVFSHDQDRVGPAEAAVKEVGLILGFGASRPEKESGRGPDGHWPLTPKMSAVIELKTGTTRPDADIKKDETDQLSGAVSWDNEVNETERCVPVLFARSERLHALASAPAGTRVITPSDLERLKSSLIAFAAEIAADERWKRPEAVAEALARHNLMADRVIQHHSQRPRPSGS
ncbi:MAG: helicase C-terminal domain-containing protein [Nocardioides sp.]